MKTVIAGGILLVVVLAGCSNTDDVVGADIQGEWQLVYEFHDRLYYQALHFVDLNNGWAGSVGGILLTTNGGNSWEYHLRKKDGESIVDLCFVDESHGWALTFRGSLYRYQAL